MSTSPLSQKELDRLIQTEQLVSNATATTGLIISTPLWALAVAFALSGPLPVLGVVPWSQSLYWVGGLTLTAAWLFAVDFAFHKARARAAQLNVWLWTFLYAAAATSLTVTWAMGFWVLWVDDNAVNHLFLTILMLAAVMNAVIGRSGHFPIFLTAMIPPVLIPHLKLLTVTTPLGPLFMILSPVWALWISYQVMGVCKDVVQAMRTRFEKEALADELANAKDEAERLRANAERANVTKTAFLANMSHELRTPLNAILGFSEIISTQALGAQANDRYREYATDILTSGRHLLSLINDLLDIAKIEAGKLEITPEWLSTEEALSECMQVMDGRALAKQITLKWSMAADCARLYADERAFRQIMFNLVSNAIKFTPESGTVEVRVRALGTNVEVTVADTGCGIPPDQIDRVFLPFEQLDNRYTKAHGGTGLGLTLVKALIELHGGRCVLTSELGRGTTVVVSFPLGDTNTAQHPTPPLKTRAA